MAWNSFKDVANRSIKRKGISPQIQESLVLETANKLFIDFLGDMAQDKIRALYWKSKILTVAILSDDVLHNLEADKEQFLQQLNKKFGYTIVEDIKILN